MLVAEEQNFCFLGPNTNPLGQSECVFKVGVDQSDFWAPGQSPRNLRVASDSPGDDCPLLGTPVPVAAQFVDQLCWVEGLRQNFELISDRPGVFEDLRGIAMP